MHTTGLIYKARRSPSVDRLEKGLQISREKALLVKGLLTGKVDVLSFESARERDRRAYHPHEPLTLAFEALNEILEGHGVAYIRSAEDTFSKVFGIDYINQGDTYRTTLLYDHAADVWRVGTWGDEVERDPRRFDE